MVYWVRSFLLPKTILTNINSMVVRLFWEGPGMKRRMHHEGPTKICKPKDEGGLRIINVVKWNKAAICCLIYKALKEETLWAQWINQNHLNNKFFGHLRYQQTLHGVGGKF